MTTVSAEKSWRARAARPALLLVLLLAGCLEKHVVWSPDGSRAAVIARDGLYLCDTDGKLTPLLLPGVYQAAWLGDSQRLVVARKRKADSWTPIAAALGSERAAAVVARAEALWKKLEAGGAWGVLTKGDGEKKEPVILKVFLRERYGEALRAKMGAGDWDELKSKQVEINELVVARLEDGKIQPGTLLHEGLDEIRDIRVGRGDRFVAVTTNQAPDNDKESRLLLVRIDVTGATAVAEHTAAYPDWTADGRSLVYVQASGERTGNDDLRLATLVQREVLNADGQIKIAEKAEDLAGLYFQDQTRVRCLRDGRILFNAAEFNLPVSVKDFGGDREKLFVLDLARQATLVRMIPRSEAEKMPKNLTFFEVGPDEKQVLVGGFDGEVSVLTLASGDVDEVQQAGEYSLMGAPVWRNAEEITYARRNPAVEGKNPSRKGEIVLRKVVLQKGDREKVLSQDWSKEMLESVYGSSENHPQGP
jgi:hypothetical protein